MILVFLGGVVFGIIGTVLSTIVRANSMERCRHCARVLTGIVLARKGTMYCCDVCAVNNVKMEDNSLKRAEILAECEEINIDELRS
jgi:hypothetical protein